jgi:hypothetical protein
MKDFNQDVEHYMRFKHDGKWFAMVPEIHTSSKDAIHHRCTGCAFLNKDKDPDASHCTLSGDLEEELRPRGIDCDLDDYPVIFVDVTKWERHIADRVAARLT